MATTTSEISEWSMQGVVFEARDIHDSSNYSYAVNFIVKGVEFTAQRVDEGSVEFGDSAVFSGTGLPDSVVTARLVEGRLRLNDTIVGQDGLWSMEITSAVLDNDGTYEIFFEQDGQEIGNGDGNKITLVKGETASEGVKSWVWITIAIVAVVILLGVGAFFFLEFEEEFDEDEEAMMEAQKEEDPYAWAKARAAEQASQQQVN